MTVTTATSTRGSWETKYPLPVELVPPETTTRARNETSDNDPMAKDSEVVDAVLDAGPARAMQVVDEEMASTTKIPAMSLPADLRLPDADKVAKRMTEATRATEAGRAVLPDHRPSRTIPPASEVKTELLRRTARSTKSSRRECARVFTPRSRNIDGSERHEPDLLVDAGMMLPEV